MSLADTARKCRRALRNETGVRLDLEELRALIDIGAWDLIVSAETEELKQAWAGTPRLTSSATTGSTSAATAGVISQIDNMTAGLVKPASTRDRYANDDAAKALYDTWSGHPGWVPWVDRGNSIMQERARREATAIRATQARPAEERG